MFTRAEFCERVCLLEQLSACQCVLVREKALRKRVCNRKHRRGPQVPRPCPVGGDSRPVQVETAYQLGLAPRAHDHRCVGAVYYVQIRKSEQRTPLHLLDKRAHVLLFLVYRVYAPPTLDEALGEQPPMSLLTLLQSARDHSTQQQH